MQIFWTRNDSTKSSEDLDDKRLNKQIIELGQILSTAIWIENCDVGETLTAMDCIYLPTHENHPIIQNCKYYYFKAMSYLTDCCEEYKHRFNKIHKTSLMLHDFKAQNHLFFNYRRMPFINCTKNHKHIISTTEAYRQCLIEKSKRKKPDWANKEEE